jgi:hypothetical protein
MDQEKRNNKREYEYGFVEISNDYKDTLCYLINMSEEGVGVFIYEPIKIDTNIKISCENHWEGERQASVKWCRHYTDGLYRAGFSFN